ncbi:unnamed protein product [Phytophthora lilii]|uniref:Unnamed protein product n=1 Tax=Phytophthora lilii TaxID=2077276 RepID=A0A9W6YGG5_9STRA|nr:unnamed protein product [Phytophthora lilii]
MVEMSSGALHYTKSFSEIFDSRHPKSERLNLGALIFALQNFAGEVSISQVGIFKCGTENFLYGRSGSSIRLNSNNARDSSEDGSARGNAEITMFSTPLENMVLAATPSSRLLVPRRFRHAFAQAIDEAVEHQLVSLCQNIFFTQTQESTENSCAGMSNDGDLFVFFYYSARLNDTESNINSDDQVDNGGRGGKVSNRDDREEECRKAVRSVNPTLSEISRGSAQNISIRNMMASTRAIISAPTKHEKRKKKKKPKKKSRWRASNAVMDHSEPHEFQRVFEINCQKRRAALMEPHRTGPAYGIAEVLLPFVELSALSLFAPDSATLVSSMESEDRSEQLDQLVWKNTPCKVSSQGVKEKLHGNNLIAWRSGPCCIFYPITTASADPENKPRIRLAMTTVFDVLEPLLRAKTKILA